MKELESVIAKHIENSTNLRKIYIGNDKLSFEKSKELQKQQEEEWKKVKFFKKLREEMKKMIRDFIDYVFNYKENTRELENLDRDLMITHSENSSLKKELKIITEQKDKYLETIKEKNKQIRQLKKQIKEMEK